MRIEIPKTSYTIGSLNKGLKLLKKPNGAFFVQDFLVAAVWDSKKQFALGELHEIKQLFLNFTNRNQF